MIGGNIKSQIEQIWNALWPGELQPCGANLVRAAIGR